MPRVRRLARQAALLAALAPLALAGCSRSGATAPATAAGAEPAGYPGPLIALTSPARGAFLTTPAGAPGALAVAGQACDAVHPLASLTVAGQAVAVRAETGCQPFALEVAAGNGLVLIEGEVENAAGQRGRLAQSVLRAPGWFAGDPGDLGAAVPSGLVLRLGPAALDDGDRASADDAATLAARVLAAVDLDAAVGPARLASPDADGDGAVDPVTHRCLLYTVTSPATGFEAWKDGPLTSGGITVDALAPVPGGLEARLKLHDLRLPFAVTGHLDSGCLGGAQQTVRGEVRVAALALDVRAGLGLDGAGAPLVTLEGVSTTLSGLDVNLALGPLADWTGLGSLIGDAIEARVRGPIQDGLRAAMAGRFQAWLVAAAARVADVEVPYDLPASLGGARLLLAARLDRLEGSPEGLLAGAALAVRAAVPSTAHASPGAPRLGGAAAPAGPLDRPVEVTLRLDALNQLLHAAWRAGAFDLADLSGLVDLSGPPAVRLAVAAGLPPLLTAAPDGRPGVELALGELAFTVELTGTPPGTAAATARGVLAVRLEVAGLELDAGGQTFHPKLAGEPVVAVEVSSADWAPGPEGREEAARLLAQLVQSRLAGLLERAAAAVPMPVVGLSGLGDGLEGLRLGLAAPRVGLDGQALVVSGALAARP